MADLQVSLSPASPEEVLPWLVLLGSALPPQRDDISMEQRVAVYRLALAEFCLPAIRSTVEKIVRGKMPEITRWLPSPPELANACRHEEAYPRRQLERLQDELRIRKGLPAPELSPQEEARRTIKANKAAAAIKGTKPANEKPWYDQPLVTEEAAQMSPELRAVLKRKWHIMGGEVPN